MNPTIHGLMATTQAGRHSPMRLLSVGLTLATISMLMAISPIPAQAQQTTSSMALACDDELEIALAGLTDTKVLLVRQFEQGEPLLLGNGADAATSTAVEGTGSGSAPIAGVDLCLIKLLVGPGIPGPADAPSTSAGIGIEVLLPTHDAWNERIRAYGNSGWAGTPQASLDVVASDDLHVAAATKGFVVATSNHGHVGSPIDPSFAMTPDGSINTVGWNDFSERSLHEVAEKTKLLTRLYYGREHTYAYWDGFSTGGRQGLKLAQVFAEDFDGILVGSPAINWTKYHTAGLYAQIAMQRDLGYLITPNKLTAATNAAISACGGAELGFLIDPLSCEYDATQDAAILCEGQASNGETGANTTETCLNVAEAQVINKIWYGQTADGAAPAPAEDNGGANTLADKNRIWFGWTRDTDLATTPAGGAPGVILAADQTALELQAPELGSDFFVNATGKGENTWLQSLDYAGLAVAQAKGVALQSEFSNINTDNPDLTDFATAGGKMVMYQGLADEYIPAQGAINYYESVLGQMGGADAVQEFYRFYLVPGFTHSGRQEGLPTVPVPQPSAGRDEMFTALQNWVENGQAPQAIEVESRNSSVSLPLCVYPEKITYNGAGPGKDAASYSCN